MKKEVPLERFACPYVCAGNSQLSDTCPLKGTTVPDRVFEVSRHAVHGVIQRA